MIRLSLMQEKKHTQLLEEYGVRASITQQFCACTKAGSTKGGCMLKGPAGNHKAR